MVGSACAIPASDATPSAKPAWRAIGCQCVVASFGAIPSRANEGAGVVD